MPFVSEIDAITKEVTDIGKFLKNVQASVIKEIGEGKCAALRQLVNILSEKK